MRDELFITCIILGGLMIKAQTPLNLKSVYNYKEVLLNQEMKYLYFNK